MTLRLTDVSGSTLDARSARLERGTITVVSDGRTRFVIARLVPGTLVLEHHRVVARAGKNGAAVVSLRKGTTVLVLALPSQARKATRKAARKAAPKARRTPPFTG
jgi:hypothetical protein